MKNDLNLLMIEPKFLTFSVDDGHPTDLRTAELLKKYGLKATFYIPKSNPEREVMSVPQIREIAEHFDVGGHTLSHKSLKNMTDQEAFSEIEGGRKWLEDTTGRKVLSFCYPQGKFNARTPDLVRKAGFLCGRTCMFNLSEFPKNPFLWGLSTHAYSHSPRVQFQHAVKEGNIRGALNFVKVYKMARQWTDHFKRAIKHVSQNGGIAHLYFHSWEIEQEKQWGQLDNLFAEISQLRDFKFVTNSEIFKERGAHGQH